MRYLEEAASASVFVVGIGSTHIDSDSGLWQYLETCVKSGSSYDARGSAGIGDDRVVRYVSALRDEPDLNYVGDLMYWMLKETKRPIARNSDPGACFMQKERLLKCLERKRSESPDFIEFLARVYCQVRSITPLQLKAAADDPAREVIAVATGAAKAEAAVSLCYTRLVNTLVVDEQLCDGMIDHIQRNQ